MIDEKLLNAISEITAKTFNEQDYGAVAGQIDGLSGGKEAEMATAQK